MKACRRITRWLLAGLLLCGISAGCRFSSGPTPADSLSIANHDGAMAGYHSSAGPIVESNPPASISPGVPQPMTEKNRVTLPRYVIEPPDILSINAIKVVPKPPYRIEPLDYLGVSVNGTFRDQPIVGTFAVEPGGTINLGAAYGKVKVSGMTLEEASQAINNHLRQILKEPEVSVTLVAATGQEQIAGEHRVSLDGTVNLGTYGTVYVTGLTLEQTKAAIERHLSKFLDAPEVSVDVYSYNSKNYYIIRQGAGLGDSVVRVPITGGETVLDAIAQVNGLTSLSSKNIWIAQPTPGNSGCEQILPVNWDQITKEANTATNYQVLPGDRLYIAEDKLTALSSFIGKVTSPITRLFSTATLGAESIHIIQHPSTTGL